jgi:PadR family transcriptional regulator, regulatory protein PadR
LITNHPGALQTPDVMGPKLGRAAESVVQEINIAFRSHRHAPRGHLELLLLATLAESEGHGYALTERLRVRSDGALQLGEGSVYAALHRLERGEFAKSRGERGSARRKRVYQITAAGRAQLGQQPTRTLRLRIIGHRNASLSAPSSGAALALGLTAVVVFTTAGQRTRRVRAVSPVLDHPDSGRVEPLRLYEAGSFLPRAAASRANREGRRLGGHEPCNRGARSRQPGPLVLISAVCRAPNGLELVPNTARFSACSAGRRRAGRSGIARASARRR